MVSLNPRCLAGCLILLSIALQETISANTCLSAAGQGVESEMYKLPRVIGNVNTTNTKLPFQLNCDTMYVLPGDTTTVYQGSLLHFPPNQFENRIIKVQGTLKLLGDKGLPVFLAGSKKENPTGVIPGDERWGGIRLDSTGSLLARHADFSNADTVFNLRSNRYTFEESFFEKCRVYVLPDRTLKVLEDGDYLTITDTGDNLSSKSSIRRRSFAPWIWSGAGVVTLGVIGTVWVLTRKEGGGNPASPEGSALEPVPILPGKPNPR